MKRIFRSLLVAGAAAVVLACSTAAMAAAPANAPQVQLDGNNIPFTDAYPQVKDGRTFVPVRAVFEALGAEVSSSGNTVSAKRDDRTVTMTVGSTQASVTDGDQTRTLNMDVAPYVDAASWRTYVPLRFASEAFGCAVGWDSDARTAVIIDMDTMVDVAMEGKEYTYLEKYAEYAQQFNEGIWNSEVTEKGSMAVTDAAFDGPITVPMTVSATAITSGETKMDMAMDMTLDMTSLVEQAEKDDPSSKDLEELKKMNDLFKAGLSFQVRGDLEKGVLYMASPVLEQPGMPANTWFQVDFNALMGMATSVMVTDNEAAAVGIIGGADGPTSVFLPEADNDSFAAMIGSMDDLENMEPVELMKAILAEIEPDSVNDYAKIKEAVEYVADLLSDKSFVKDGDNYVLTVEPEGDIPEESAKLVFTLTMKDEKVVGYAMEMTAKVDGEDPASMSIKMAVDENNKLSGSMKMSVSSELDAQFTITGQYTKGTTEPETEPPAGANVVPIDVGLSLLAGNMMAGSAPEAVATPEVAATPAE